MKILFNIIVVSALIIYSFCIICVVPFQISHKLMRNGHKSIFMASSGDYLQKLVQRKKIEVDTLLRLHQEQNDPLVMRMSYMASKCNYNVTNSLKKDLNSNEDFHLMNVIIDMKRKSPTVPQRRNIVEFSTAGKFSELLTLCGADAFFVNTDEIEYGGNLNDLKEVSKAVKSIKPINTPACIIKDIIIHPVQIAQALELGATGVLLIVAVVGKDLETLLDACTIMGVEALVEVHTPNELDYALSRGATLFLVNMWDRFTGRLYLSQAEGLAKMMPMNAVAAVAGNILSAEQAVEFGYYGYDAVVLGRGISEVPDIKEFISGIHDFRGIPRGVGLGVKGAPYL